MSSTSPPGDAPYSSGHGAAAHSPRLQPLQSSSTADVNQLSYRYSDIFAGFDEDDIRALPVNEQSNLPRPSPDRKRYYSAGASQRDDSSTTHIQHSVSSADVYCSPPTSYSRQSLPPTVDVGERHPLAIVGSGNGASEGPLGSPQLLSSSPLRQEQPLQQGLYAPVPTTAPEVEDTVHLPATGSYPVLLTGVSSPSLNATCHTSALGMYRTKRPVTPTGMMPLAGEYGSDAGMGCGPGRGSWGYGHDPMPSNTSIGGSSIGRPSSRESGSVYGLVSSLTMDPSIRDSYIHVGRDTVLQSSPLNNKQLPLSSSYYAEADRAPGVARYAGLGDAHRRQEDHRVHYSQRKKAVIVGIVALIVAAVCVAVVVPVTEHFLNKPDTSSEPGGIVDKDGNVVATTGGNGSVIILEDGTKYTYINPFGGTWNSGLLNNSAQAQWYTPPLSEEFHFGGKQGNRRRQGSRASGSSENGSSGRIIGVNVGGWLVTEPFIVPALYEPYANGPNAAVDEFTLSQQWLKEGGLARLKQKLTQHYDTFITERDFADIACAGLNWVRLPIGFWALETIDDEPFLEGVSWQYFLKAIQWARKYGLRINLDLHAVPGSANSFNHGGKLGPTPPSTVGINFLQGPAGLVNAQRALNYIRIITEFISQPEIAPVVPMFTVINEPYLPTAIGVPALSAWYAELYSEIRNNITGLGKGHGPFIGMHDGFLGLRQWENYMPGADRIGWDVHPYIAFGPKYTDDFSKIVPGFCNAYGPQIDRALANNGLSFAGEWSPAVNDCGLYLNGVGLGTRYENTYQGNGNVYGNCTKWTDWTKWDETMKSSIRQFAEVSMDSLKNTFFWSWKIGNSSQSGRVEAPTWSYQLGLQQGWLPTDPYHAGSNACSSAASSYSASIAATTSWSSTFEGWKTGDTAAPYTANPSAYPWPPSSISGAGVAVTNMPSYTRTGSISKAPPPAWTESQSRKPNPTISNWAQKSDNAPMYVKVKGCSYQLDQYSVSGIPGSWPCSGSAMSKRKTTSIPTPTTT